MKITSFKKRLTLGLMLIVFFFIAQATLTWVVEERIKQGVVDTVRKNTQATSQLNELAILAQQIRRYEKEYFVYVGDVERRTAYEKEWSVTAGKISASLAKMRANAGGAFGSSDSAQITVWWAAGDFYAAEMRKVFDAVTGQASRVALAERAAAAPVPAPPPEKGKNVAASKVDEAPAPKPVMFSSGEVNEMIKAGKDRFSNDLIKGVATLQAEKTKETLALADVARDGFNTLLVGIAISAALGSVIALALAFTLPGAILKPVEALTAAVEKISVGQTHVRVPELGVLEFHGLAKAVERMRVAQETLVNRMRARSG
ncbi:HAMP domain-containing protein [Polaromonas sp.]|uniref:HAMP domain-containing protein n=1 Tax=Polaromonas sp. TaxID=1869339 RepID=UPI0037538E15